MKKVKLLVAMLIAMAVLVPTVAFALGTSDTDATYTYFEGRVLQIHANYPFATTIRVVAEDYNMFDFMVGEDTLFVNADGYISVEEIGLGDGLRVYFIEPLISASIFPPFREAAKFVQLYEGSGISDIQVGGPLLLDQETIDQLNAQLAEDLQGAPIIVHGEKIDAPEALVKNGVVFLPLRAVAEALGYDVFWEAETASIALGVGVRLQVGSYEYLVGRMAPITLYNAPILVNELTYVPLEFFGMVLSFDAGFIIEEGRAEIMISDREWEI